MTFCNRQVVVLLVLLAGIFWGLKMDSVLAKTKGMVEGGSTYIAYGDIRGYLEPCGCDPSSDLGGLKRIAAVRSRVLGLDKRTTVLDLGNFLPNWLIEKDPNEDEVAKINAISLAIKNVLKPDVILLNELEEKWIASSKKINIDSWSTLNFVRTGYTKPRNWPNRIKIHDYYKTHFGVVFGFYAGTESATLSTESHIWIQKTREIIDRNPEMKSLKRILLFAGRDSDLKSLVSSGLFDVILSSNVLPLEATVDNREFNNPSTIYRSQSDQVVRMVPVGGQGVWIFGFSTESKKWIQPLSSLFEKDNVISGSTNLSSKVQLRNTEANTAQTISFQDTDLIWLTPSWNFGSEIDPIMRKYNEIIAKNFQREEMNRRLRAKDSKYVGAEACKSCHASSYEVWLSSSHSTAIKSLVKKSKDKDSECVYCHVVGFHDGGYVSSKITPHFSGVQCENCHGARKDHLSNPYDKTKIYKDAKSSCEECHQGMHSPNFQFQSYWQKILHK